VFRAGWVGPIRQDRSARVAARASAVGRTVALLAVQARRTVAECRATRTFLRRRSCGQGCSLPSLCLTSGLIYCRNLCVVSPVGGIAEGNANHCNRSTATEASGALKGKDYAVLAFMTCVDSLAVGQVTAIIALG
jgi:hypothetical protein